MSKLQILLLMLYLLPLMKTTLMMLIFSKMVKIVKNPSLNLDYLVPNPPVPPPEIGMCKSFDPSLLILLDLIQRRRRLLPLKKDVLLTIRLCEPIPMLFVVPKDSFIQVRVSLLDNAPNQVVRYDIQKRRISSFFNFI